MVLNTIAETFGASTVAPWPGGQGGHGPPILETRPKIVNVVGNCRKIVKAVDGVGGGEDLKCCPENILVCRKIFLVCRKSTALGSPKI